MAGYQNMGEDYKLIAVITPNTTNWTAKVVVLEKISARTSYLSPTKYQNVVLMDMEGSQSQQNLIAHSASMPQLNKLFNFTTDSTASINGTMIGEPAERMVQCSAD
ncbi:Uncharacterized protein Fot_55937 [Forsythia ovata]|uniref:Uncharacterized protein n=1 Tax=Forsythia ovata TaxID=205694 RepID=A0ABD1P4J5_9LAMI